MPKSQEAAAYLPRGRPQRWSLDFVHDSFVSGQRFCILCVVDDFTRECLALVADTSLSGTNRRIPTINELSERYLNFVRFNKKSHDIDERYLRLHLLPKFGRLHLDQLCQEEIGRAEPQGDERLLTGDGEPVASDLQLHAAAS